MVLSNEYLEPQTKSLIKFTPKIQKYIPYWAKIIIVKEPSASPHQNQMTPRFVKSKLNINLICDDSLLMLAD